MLYIFPAILHHPAIFLISESQHRHCYIEILESELQPRNICKDRKDTL